MLNKDLGLGEDGFCTLRVMISFTRTLALHPDVSLSFPNLSYAVMEGLHGGIAVLHGYAALYEVYEGLVAILLSCQCSLCSQS